MFSIGWEHIAGFVTVLLVPGVGAIWWLFSYIQKKHDEAIKHANDEIKGVVAKLDKIADALMAKVDKSEAGTSTRFDNMEARIIQINEARDKARQEMARHLHDRINEVKDNYVRKDHFREVTDRIDRNVERMVEMVAGMSATVHQLMGAAKNRGPDAT